MLDKLSIVLRIVQNYTAFELKKVQNSLKDWEFEKLYNFLYKTYRLNIQKAKLEQRIFIIYQLVPEEDDMLLILSTCTCSIERRGRAP